MKRAFFRASRISSFLSLRKLLVAGGLILALVLVLIPVGAQSQSWLDPAWQYRSVVTITNSGGTVLTGFQVHVALDSSFDFTKAKTDGSDIRFTSNDGFTLLPFWIEAWNPGNRTASLWVRVPTIPSGGAGLYMYYGNSAAISASNGTATFEFFDDFNSLSLDTSKWRASGGSWSVNTDIQQDGSTGGVARGTIGGDIRGVLLSLYQGSDYVLEAYGKQLSGRVWGLGVRATDQNNLYSINLYEDLDSTYNLYVYNWVNGSASTLTRTPVERVDSNTWYKLSVKVHGNSIDVYKDNALRMQTSAFQYGSGAVALYGEQNTVAEFDNVLVRKYAAVDPAATLQSGLPPTVTSVSLNPSSVVGGSSSQGTVVLSGPAPSGGAMVSLSSSNNTEVASVPASVTVSSGSASANFMVSTNPVSSSTAVIISASYNGTTQTAILTVSPPQLSSLSLNPSSVVGGSSSQGTVVLSGSAPSGGAVVSLSSSNTQVASVPTSVTVSGGSISANFTVSTNSVSSSTAVIISASYRGNTQLATLMVRAQSGGDWLDPAWQYRSVVTITNSGGTVLTGFQVHVTLDSSFDFTKAKTDGSDIRFTSNDGFTLLPFWIEAWSPGNRIASLWVRVPTIPVSGATLYMYYGNSAAGSASDGTATFEFFDDFDSTGSTLYGYYDQGVPQTVLSQNQSWESSPPHTLSVVEANSGGYIYWGYYGLVTGCGGAGLARSNDLVSWTKYSGNPLFLNGRWPSVLKVGNTFYMLYEKDYCATSYIELAISSDGIHFSDVKTIVQPQAGIRNQNPNLFYNPNDGKYYIYWYHGNGASYWAIRARSAFTINGLDNSSSEIIVLQSDRTLAAPNMLFYDGNYFLSTESQDDYGNWEVLIYSSTSPTTGFSLLPGNPVLANGSACFFQRVFGPDLHNYYCKLTSGVWTLEHRMADLNAGRLDFHEVDTSRWSPTGGSWWVTTDTQQDGSEGGVAEGIIGSDIRGVLLSLYQGSDYVLEAYGNLNGGRVWGLGVRATDKNNLYSVNLYEDLDSTYNLYVYNWVNGSPSTLTRTTVGRVDANTWYKLLVKVHGNSIDVYKDNVLVMQTSASQYGAGRVALYGEQYSVGKFNSVLVRKYAATEPSAMVMP